MGRMGRMGIMPSPGWWFAVQAWAMITKFIRCFIAVTGGIFSLAAVSAGPVETVSGYIREVPPEPAKARETRHREVAARRAGTAVIIHRGASDFAPENTLEACAAAMDHGADGCEIDIH